MSSCLRCWRIDLCEREVWLQTMLESGSTVHRMRCQSVIEGHSCISRRIQAFNHNRTPTS